MKSDGFSLDDKRDFIDGKGDIPDIVEKYKIRSSGENSIVVPFEDIKNNDYNLSISRYKEVKHEDIVYEEPEKLIDANIKKHEELLEELKELKKMVRR